MQIKNKMNVIIIVCDSARNYKSGKDDRDRLDVEDELRSEWVNFESCITSAPSSVLSGAAMMTGFDCAYVSRHFNDFSFREGKIQSMPPFLEKRGYQSFVILNSKEEREKFVDLAPPLPYSKFPPGISHGRWWTNEELYDITKHLFDTKQVTQPAFFLLWFDCRNDAQVTHTIKRTIKLFKDEGMLDNGFIALTSDHGYPDPSSGLTKELMKKYSHDMIVTQDNINVPLLIHYPGAPVKNIRPVVGLVDLFPTVLDLLGVEGCEELKKNMNGRSLIPLVEKEEADANRVVRVDTRLQMASGRITALVGNRFKYVHNLDIGEESLFDLVDDKFEIRDLAHDPAYAEEMKKQRKLFEDKQEHLEQFHFHEMGELFNENIKSVLGSNSADQIKSILIAYDPPRRFVERLVASLRVHCKNAEVTFLSDASKKRELPAAGVVEKTLVLPKLDFDTVKAAQARGEFGKFDLVVAVTENSSFAMDTIDDRILGLLKLKKSILIDYNMKVYTKFLVKWIWPFIPVIRLMPFYRQEPRLLFNEIWRTGMRGFKTRILKRKMDNAFDLQKFKQMRDREIKQKKEREEGSLQA